jgi:protein dithiol oxidoreductase (disulfide-forming)
MDRRNFVLSAVTWTLAARADSPEVHGSARLQYVTLPSGEPTATRAGLIEVVEAFSYTCIHCWRFEPHIRKWLTTKPAFVSFIRLPSLWDDRHRAHAKLYYTLQVLGRNDLDDAAFTAIHREHNPLYAADPEEALALQTKFVEAHAISAASFINAYDSPTVASKLKTAAEFLTRFEITETPAMVIGGKYMTDGYHIGLSDQDEDTMFDRLIELTDYLVATERRRHS